MRSLARMPLEGGGVVLFEASPEPVDRLRPDGPVKAGRTADVIRDLPRTLEEALAPVGNAAQAVLTQLREAGPDEVEVEFGVDLSAGAGAR